MPKVEKTKPQPRKSQPQREKNKPQKTDRASEVGNPNDDAKRETNGYKLGLKPPTSVELFYDVRDASYWYRLHGRYIAMQRSDLVKQMKGLGLRDDIFF